MNETLKSTAIRGLSRSIQPPASLRAEIKTREAFRDDGLIERRVVASAIPLLSLDWVVAPSAPVGVHIRRLTIPENSRATRIALVSTANASATFSVDVLVNGVVKAGGAIRSGVSGSGLGVISVPLQAGSVVSIETKSSIAQAVTVSVFYRPEEV